MEQQILQANGEYGALDAWFAERRVRCAMLVCGESIRRLPINAYFESVGARLGVRIVRFSDFRPNPLYESVTAAVALFRAARCDAIIAVGGGSAIDVAKCVKLYSPLPGDGADGAFLSQSGAAAGIPFLAMPTTSGTGSEATRFAVIYYGGAKQSVSDIGCIPDTVLLDAGVLKTLPPYQKKATMMDALCHAVESYWSVNSSAESMAFSERAIRGVIAHMDGYLANSDAGNAGMLLAANTAGKAINLTQTTAGHAMCYKLTALFGCAHGHAAALCDRVLYAWMAENVDKCTDPRGPGHLARVLDAVAAALGCADARSGAAEFRRLFDSLELEVPAATDEQFALLRRSVNPVRLKNNPIALDEDTIDALYHLILDRRNA